MYPYIPFGPWFIPSYYVFLGLGAVVGGLVGWREAVRMGFTRRRIIAFYFIVFPGALFLGLVNGWIFNLDFYHGLSHGQLVLYGGLVTYGVILGALGLGSLYAKRRGLSAGELFDLIVLVLPLMLAITRIGCLLNGCCYGRETDGFGGVYLPDKFGQWADRYPTQILLLLLNLGLFLWLWFRRRRGMNRGSEVLPYLFWYAAGRLAIDSLRMLPAVVWGLGFHQLTAIVILIVVAGLWLKQRVLAGRQGG